MLNLMASVVAGEQSIFIFRLMPNSFISITMCFVSYEVKADCSSAHDRVSHIKTSDRLPVLDRSSCNVVNVDPQVLREGNSPDKFAVQLPWRFQYHLRHHVAGI